MISTAIDKNFTRLFDVLMKFNFMAPTPPAFGNPPAIAEVATLMEGGAPRLPMVYRAGYATPLHDELANVFERLTSSDGQLDTISLETLTACVYQHGDPTYRGDLRRFLAVVSNMYRSFLDSAKRSHLKIDLRSTKPPLVMFQSNPGLGPFTITCETMNRLIGSPIGVVSLPRTFAEHPLLYGSLAHETGGHDIIHADEALMPQLRVEVQALFTGDEAWLGVLWDYWMDEAASDVYGLLNIGPAFAYNLALLLTVFIAQASGASGGPALRTESGANRDGVLDVHPTDILRIALLQGAIETLTGLSQATRSAYVDRLARLSEALSGGASTVDLNGFLRTEDRKSLTLQESVRLDVMQAAARRVGAMIATVPLQALGGRPIQDIETWDDADENAAMSIAGRLGSGSSIIGVGDDAQILAGVTLAAIRQPDSYAAISELANAALNDSFNSDPIWGIAPRDLMVVRPALHRGQTEAPVDPYAALIIDFNPQETASDGLPFAAAGAVTHHAIAAIPWPAGEAPQPDPDFIFKGDDAALPKADFVIVTWTAAEANALAAVMTPGSWAMPPSNWLGPAWHRYTNQWDAKFAGRSTGHGPAAVAHYIGKYMPVLIGGRKVLLFKSNFHLARDDKSVPVIDMFKQIIQQTGARLVITTGTAGAIGSKLELGDVVVANHASFKLDGAFKSAPYNGRTFTSPYAPIPGGRMKVVNDKLVQPNANQLDSAALPPVSPAPRIFVPGDQAKIGEPVNIVTTDRFEYDEVGNKFGLQGKGAMVEMDDALVGVACEELGGGPQWLAIRNASDPQMPAGATSKLSADIYLKYGYWTSIPSVLACWASILDF